MNPFQVLGVSPSDSKEDIKKAYKELAKKYHPDRFTDKKEKAEAEKKMKEINSAYDAIRRGEGKSDYSEHRYVSITSRYREIKSLIDKWELVEAKKMLNGIPFNYRGAMWNYYMATILFRNRRYEDAYVLAQKAWYKHKAYDETYIEKEEMLWLINTLYDKTLSERQKEIHELDKINDMMEEGLHFQARNELKNYKKTHTYLPADYYYLMAKSAFHYKKLEAAEKNITDAMCYYSSSNAEKYKDLYDEINVPIKKKKLRAEKVRKILKIIFMPLRIVLWALKHLLITLICVVISIISFFTPPPKGPIKK